MLTLFLSYETTRLNFDQLKEIPDWKNDEDSNTWQLKLYKDVIQEANTDKTQYLTLKGLIDKNKAENNGKLKFYGLEKDIPIFLFGFSGMGQIYRNTLLELSQTFNLNIYLQASNSRKKNIEIIENWSKYGLENLNLWNSNSKGQLELLESENSGDSLLCNLQNAIITGNEVKEYKKDDSVIIASAPSKRREIEALHSKVCSLLTEKNVSLGDMIVLAPNISEYKLAVQEVFEQNKKGDSEYPYIPTVILDDSSHNSLISSLLNKISSIMLNGFMTRADFFHIVNNPVVKACRKITDEAIEKWTRWILDMEIYRDRQLFSDWENARKKLLLSLLSENQIKIKDKEIKPYFNIDTQDKDLVFKFISAVDDIKKFLEKEIFDLSKNATAETLRELKDWFDKFALIDSDQENSLSSEAVVYRKVISELNSFIELAGRGFSIPLHCVLLALVSASANVSLASGSLHTGGLSFASFKSNRTISADYVFILGVSSKSLPGEDKDNVLDLRVRQQENGDESIPAKNRNAFLCELMAAKKAFYVSYVNKDLKKDSDFFNSSLIDDLKKLIKAPKNDIEIKIPLDEKRLWNELFTDRAIRNKRSLVGTSLQISAKDSPAVKVQEANPLSVSLWEMEKFLEEPLKFRIDKTLGYEKDHTDDEIQEYEPLSLNQSVLKNIKRELAQLKYRNSDANLSGLTETLDSMPLKNKIYADIESESEGYKNCIVKYYNENNSAVVFDKVINLTLEQRNGENSIGWTLTGDAVWYNNDFEYSKELIVVDYKSTTRMYGYLTALAVLAEKQIAEEITVFLPGYVANADGAYKKVNKKTYNFSCNSLEARTLLNSIYKAAFIEKFNKCVPFGFITNKFSTLEDFSKNLFAQHGPWEYFKKSRLLMPLTPQKLGYSEHNFNLEWIDAKDHQLNLIKFKK